MWLGNDSTRVPTWIQDRTRKRKSRPWSLCSVPQRRCCTCSTCSTCQLASSWSHAAHAERSMPFQCLERLSGREPASYRPLRASRPHDLGPLRPRSVGRAHALAAPRRQTRRGRNVSHGCDEGRKGPLLPRTGAGAGPMFPCLSVDSSPGPGPGLTRVSPGVGSPAAHVVDARQAAAVGGAAALCVGPGPWTPEGDTRPRDTGPAALAAGVRGLGGELPNRPGPGECAARTPCACGT